MAYNIRLKRTAEKELDGLPSDAQQAVLSHIIALKDTPRPIGMKKLKGGSSDYRIRVGKYRVIYSIDDTNELVEILAIAHRRDAYR